MNFVNLDKMVFQLLLAHQDRHQLVCSRNCHHLHLKFLVEVDICYLVWRRDRLSGPL